LAGHDGAALALRSHFFEFIDARGEARLAHQIERGKHYQVVVTTGGGLYRYRLGDFVEVCGFVNHCPLLRFAGRADARCDLIGEKLSDDHARQAIDQALALSQFSARFVMLVPVDQGGPRYRLYLQLAEPGATSAALARLRDDVESLLSQNPYYDHARRFGQLSMLQVHLLAPASPAWAVYERACLELGQKLGDIKPTLLHNGSDWPRRFEPLTEARTPE
jgi:hypothetical protein